MKYYFYDEKGRVYLIYEGEPETNLLDMPHIYCEDVYENVNSKNKVYYVDLETGTLKVEYEDMLIEPTIDDKISILEGEQETQNEEILSNMLATTEVFEMILTMSAPMSVDIENKNKNLGGSSMVEVYVTLILKGVKTIDQVPAIIRDQVQAQLDLLTK